MEYNNEIASKIMGYANSINDRNLLKAILVFVKKADEVNKRNTEVA